MVNEIPMPYFNYQGISKHLEVKEGDKGGALSGQVAASTQVPRAWDAGENRKNRGQEQIKRGTVFHHDSRRSN